MPHVLDSQRDLFDLPADLAYFNCASLSPLMKSAREAGKRAFDARTTPWLTKSAHWFDDVERRRALFARLIDVSAENVALIPATSYGLATAAKNLQARPKQRVLVLADEFPSNYHTWRGFCTRRGCELLVVRRSSGPEWTEAVLAAIDERVAIVAVPNVHWTDGAFVDLVAVSRAARAVDAHLVVDASQSLGVMPFDFAAVRPDFLVAVGYKWLLGPLGLGYLYVADQHLGGEPLEENWISRAGSEDFSRVDYGSDYRSGARRFDVGQRTMFEVTPAAVAVLEQLLEWGVGNIAATLAAKVKRIEQETSALGLALTTQGRHAPHMLGLKLPATSLTDAAAKLQQRRVYAAVRGPAIRISPHVYTADEDIDRLIGALKGLAT
jgi:selenocysteine lyase/cysteine desulfurase